ncbi:MAG: winged helix-turn-helix domain-containing protein [Patescibacteria group bacterium]
MNKRWVNVFKALSNINRIKIIKTLSRGKSLSVTEMSEELGISVKSTSKHLIMLQNLDLLESNGKHAHVFYSLNKNLPPDFKKTISLFC